MGEIDKALREELLTLSREIHADPELAYEEHRAADRICAFLEKHGHKVERPLGAPTKPHPRLGEILREELAKQGVDAVPDVLVLASTDFGNVSQAVPADYIGFPVVTKRIGGHNIEMRDSSITDLAHKNAFVTIQALAGTARRIATDQKLRSELRS